MPSDFGAAVEFLVCILLGHRWTGHAKFVSCTNGHASTTCDIEDAHLNQACIITENKMMGRPPPLLQRLHDSSIKMKVESKAVIRVWIRPSCTTSAPNSISFSQTIL